MLPGVTALLPIWNTAMTPVWVGAVRTWLDHADHGYGQRLLCVGKTRRSRRVAGNHYHFHAAAHEPRPDLLHESVDLGKGSGTVGASRGIAQVAEGFVRQFLRDVARDGKPAESGVEDADGRIACAGENGLGVCCGFHAWKYTPAVRACSVHHNMTNGLFAECAQKSASGRSWGAVVPSREVAGRGVPKGSRGSRLAKS